MFAVSDRRSPFLFLSLRAGRDFPEILNHGASRSSPSWTAGFTSRILLHNFGHAGSGLG